jgi:hypothetical protein
MIVMHGWRLESPYWIGPDGVRLVAISGGSGLEPAVIIAIVGASAAVAGTAVATYAAYQQGQQAQAAGKYNAKVAENQALAARQAAGLRADDLRARARAIESTNVARAAGGGILPTAGSPLFVMADNAMQAELDAQRVQYGGEVEAVGFQSQARLARFGARRASEAGMFRAGSTLLSGAATAASFYGGKPAQDPGWT